MSSTFDEEAVQSAGSVASTKSTSDLSNSLEQSLSSVARQSAESQLTQKLSSVVPESVAGVAASEALGAASNALTGANGSEIIQTATSDLENAAVGEVSQIASKQSAVVNPIVGETSAFAMNGVMKAAMARINNEAAPNKVDSYSPANRTVSINFSAGMPTTPRGEPALIFHRLNGEEKLSELYSYNVELITPYDPLFPVSLAANIDFKALIGKETTVSIELDGNGSGGFGRIGAGIREISGIVTQAKFLRSEKSQAVYEIVIRPWLYLTTLTTDYKRFQEKSVIDIVKEVLSDYCFSLEDRTTENYPNLIYQVQYGESDFDFIQRLMQEWGIYWFYEHGNSFHRLILVDSLGSHKKVESEAYHVLRVAAEDVKIDEEYISSFDVIENLRPGNWVTNDFDFQKPLANLSAKHSKPRETNHNEHEIYQWPGDYTDPSVGTRLAKIRMEEAAAEGMRAQGSGILRDVVCGTTFTLIEHPVEKANQDYLVISAALSITENQQRTGKRSTIGFNCYTNFSVQPADKIFRPEQNIKKPLTTGPQTAIVTGPKGDELWTDVHGRVKVQFHWDRYGTNDEKSSPWIRVSSPWAGSGFGGIQVPRIGQEVIVDFENGDPDRPIITGRVYNGKNKSPWSLPDSATQSGFRTNSTGGSGGFNEMRFEDKGGKEEVFIHAQKDMNTVIQNDETLQVKSGNRTITVENGNHSNTIAKGHSTKLVNLSDSTTANIINTTAKAGDAGSGVQTHAADDQIKHTVGNDSSFIDILPDHIKLSHGSSTILLNDAGVFINGSKVNLNNGS